MNKFYDEKENLELFFWFHSPHFPIKLCENGNRTNLVDRNILQVINGQHVFLTAVKSSLEIISREKSAEIFKQKCNFLTLVYLGEGGFVFGTQIAGNTLFESVGSKWNDDTFPKYNPRPFWAIKWVSKSMLEDLNFDKGNICVGIIHLKIVNGIQTLIN